MRRLVLVALAAACLSGPAFAADNDPKAPTRAAEYAKVPQDAVLSHNLVGLNLVDGQQNSVGEIQDLVIESGQLKAYIVSVGGFLGVGDRYVAVTPSSVSLGYDETSKRWKGIIAADKDALKAAPEFKYEGKFKR